MVDPKAVIDSLRHRLPAHGAFFNLLEAIDAFEASYRSDRFGGHDDSLTLVGGQGDRDDGAYFSLALGRSIGGDISEFPTLVTAGLEIKLVSGDVFASELDERFGGLSPSPGQMHLVCDDQSSADSFFARVRRLPLVQKYGGARPSSCELKLMRDDEMREICGKLIEYFEEHGCPSDRDS